MTCSHLWLAHSVPCCGTLGIGQAWQRGAPCISMWEHPNTPFQGMWSEGAWEGGRGGVGIKIPWMDSLVVFWIEVFREVIC